MTPSAIQSATVRKEWRYERQQGVFVYPVKGAAASESRFSQLPRWMSKAHFLMLVIRRQSHHPLLVTLWADFTRYRLNSNVPRPSSPRPT